MIDLRALFPWDRETILESVGKDGRLPVVQEPPGTAGVASDVAAVVAEQAVYPMEAPVRRVTGVDVPWPGRAIEQHGPVDTARVSGALDRLAAD